jgi:dehydration protein DpgD
MDEPPVRYDKRGRVAYVTLNRPSVLNAMNLRTHELLADIWDDADRDPDVWVVVLTGAGDRAFSAGQDLKELAGRLRTGARPSTFGAKGAPGHPRLTERFTFSKPLVARVNGLALGGGFELVLACDIVVAADHAFFALPEVRHGLVAGAGGVFRLGRHMPFRAAMGHLLTGRRMSADQALRYGLVNDVVPADGLDRCVDGWVDDLLKSAPLAVRATKEAALRSANLSLEEAFAASYGWEELRRDSHDAREGPLAFVEKRQPVWRGE